MVLLVTVVLTAFSLCVLYLGVDSLVSTISTIKLYEYFNMQPSSLKLIFVKHENIFFLTNRAIMNALSPQVIWVIKTVRWSVYWICLVKTNMLAIKFKKSAMPSVCLIVLREENSDC